MIDSWYYSACVKFKTELFNSHHLIYNYFGYYWFILLQKINPKIEAITALNLLNAIAAIACLYLIYECLIKLKTNATNALWLSLFCGVSFGFMRYATDAETYILPIAFSLGSTLLFIKNEQKNHLFYAGLLAAIALLFHQVHLWWTIAMFISLLYSKPFKIKKIVSFTTPLLFVAIIYWIVYKNGHFSFTFFEFVVGEYGKGNAGFDLSWKAFLLTIINVFRTFIQLHGNIMALFQLYPLVEFTSISLALAILIRGFIKQDFKYFFQSKQNLNKSFFLMAMILQITFAFISSGNAEFMVMLPFLLILSLVSAFQLSDIPFVKHLTVSILIWNLSVAIIPNAILKLNMVEKQTQISIQQEKSYSLWKNKPLVENRMNYIKGFDYETKYLLHLKSISSRTLDSLLENSNTIYTDLPNSDSQYSRANLLSNHKEIELLANFRLIKYDSFDNIYGKNYIYSIRKRAD